VVFGYDIEILYTEVRRIYMKRDMDLIRKILFAVEEFPVQQENFDINISGHTKDEINYHLELLLDANLIKAKYNQNMLGDYIWLFIRLTWNGHEFIDASRDDDRWEKAKGAMNKVGGVVLPILMQLLTSYMKAELKLP
jgi:hypothetical protein